MRFERTVAVTVAVPPEVIVVGATTADEVMPPDVTDAASAGRSTTAALTVIASATAVRAMMTRRVMGVLVDTGLPLVPGVG